MSAIFSIDLWLIFLNRIIKASHPLIFALALLFLLSELWRLRRMGWRGFKPAPATWIFAGFAAVDIMARLLVFFAGVPYQTRYFLPLTLCAVVLAAWSMPVLSAWLALKTKGRFPALTRRRIFAALVSLTVLICAAKVFIPQSSKDEMRIVAELIKTNLPPGSRCPVLISKIADPRYAYYAGAVPLYFWEESNPVKNIYHRWMVTAPSIGKKAGKQLQIGLPYGLENIGANVRWLGGDNVFVLVDMPDAEFRRLFAAAKIDFPLRLVGEVDVSKGKVISLYQGTR